MEKYLIQLGEMQWGKVFLASLVLAALYHFGVPGEEEILRTQISQLEADLAAKRQVLQDTKDAMASAEKFEKAVRDSEAKFQGVLKYLPTESSNIGLTSLLNERARSSETRLLELKPTNSIDRKDFYETVKLNLKLSGTFEQLMRFMSGLTRAERLLTFENLKISAVEAQTVQPGVPPVVEMEATLVAYRYLKDAVSKDPAQMGEPN